MNSNVEIDNKRKFVGGDGDYPRAKKVKIDDLTSKITSAQSILREAMQDCNGFQSSSSDDFKEKVRQDVEKANQILSAIELLVPAPATSSSLSPFQLLFQEAITLGDRPEIEKYLNECMENNDFDRFLNDCTLNRDVVLQLFLSIALQNSSEKLFSTIMRAICLRGCRIDKGNMAKMRQIFNTEDLSDLTLTICSKESEETTTIQVNKAYLAYRIPYFNDLYFGDHPKEEGDLTFTVEELQSHQKLPLTQENVYDVIRYCHTETIYFRDFNPCLAILLLANNWGIEPLVKTCESYLSTHFLEFPFGFNNTGYENFKLLFEIAKKTKCMTLKDELVSLAGAMQVNSPNVTSHSYFYPQIVEEENKELTKFISRGTFSPKKIDLESLPSLFPKVKMISLGLIYSINDTPIDPFIKLQLNHGIKLVESRIYIESEESMKKVLNSDLPALNTMILVSPLFANQVTYDGPGIEKIRHLNMLESEFSPFREKGFNFLGKCINLESLHLPIGAACSNFDIRKLNHLKRLRELDVKMAMMENEEELYLAVINLDRLESFKINYSNSSGIYLKMPFFFKFKKKSSCFKSYEANIPMSGDALLELSSHLDFIQNLSFYTMCYDGDSVHQASFPSNSELKVLKWNCMNRFPVLPFLKSLGNIEELHLIDAKLNDEVIEQLKRFPNLHTLHLENIENLDNEVVAELTKLPLEALTFADCDGITHQGLPLLSKCKTLQKLVFKKCGNILFDINELSKRVPHVRVLEHKSALFSNFLPERKLKVLEFNPMHVEALSFCAKSEDVEHVELAIKNLKVAVVKEPTNVIYWKLLALAYYNAQQEGLGEEPFAKAFALGMKAREFFNEVKSLPKRNEEEEDESSE